MYPDLGIISANSTFTIGTLGLFTVLSFAVGNLVQAFGNFLALVWWFCWRGNPSDWIRQNRGNILHSGQRDLFKKKLKSALHYNKTVNELNEINKKDWATITRQILIIAKRNKETKRIDMFLTNYGLYRGLAASLVVLAASVFLKYQTLYLWVVGLLLLAAILSLYRMHRFSEHYAKELFMEFLEQKED